MLHQPIAAADGATPSASPRAGTPWAWTARRFAAAVAAIWLAGAGVLTALQAHAIAIRDYPDPDDYLRLVEVRAWLAGQSFWDVSQHRVNQPFGAPMHWSRIVDMPIALAELAFRPLFGVAGAEVAAAIVVPLLTLGVVMAAVAVAARRLAGPGPALVATALLPTALVTVVQLKPLRVDHHGWEIAFSLVALAAMLSPGRRGGWLAGVAVAIGLQISLEQLPFAAALGAVIGGRWVLDPSREQARRLTGYAVALAATEAALFVALHAPSGWGVFCDSISPPHLLALAIAGTGCALWAWAAPNSIWLRGAGLALIAGAGAAACRAIPPHCGLDAFSALGPLEKTVWLANVPEGQPVWRSSGKVMIAAVGFPVVALIACGFAAREARGERRALWLSYAAILAATTATGILVLRACSLADAVACVPAGWAMARLVARAQRSARSVTRVLGSAAAILGLGPLAPAVLGAALPFAGDAPDDRVGQAIGMCKNPATWRDLNALPPARIMSSIDISPSVLFGTHHAVLATGHHRNHLAIAEELRAWLGDESRARAILAAHGIGYVLICPALDETEVYAKTSLDGFSARLTRGRTPVWLSPVPMPGSSARLWRVLPAQPPAGSPSSRSGGGLVPITAQIARSADLKPSS